MAMRIPGPMDPLRNSLDIKDGTLARQPSPQPGSLCISDMDLIFKAPKYKPIQTNPSRWDQATFWTLKRLYNEKWFESRYPKTLKVAHLHIANIVYIWSIDPNNKHKTIFKDEGKTKSTRTRISISPLDTIDPPQNDYEHNEALGHFTIDVETPFSVERTLINGVNGIKWKGQMYIEDIVGDPTKTPSGLKWAFQEKKVIRAKWFIGVDITDFQKPVMTFHEYQSPHSSKLRWVLNPVQQQLPHLRKSGVHNWVG